MRAIVTQDTAQDGWWSIRCHDFGPFRMEVKKSRHVTYHDIVITGDRSYTVPGNLFDSLLAALLRGQEEGDPADDRQDAVLRAMAERDRLLAAIIEHHSQKADDRCWLDDCTLYQAAGLPPPDLRVGDKEAMLINCARYIDRRCEGGGWPSYRELEQERDRLAAELEKVKSELAGVKARFAPVRIVEPQEPLEVLEGDLKW